MTTTTMLVSTHRKRREFHSINCLPTGFIEVSSLELLLHAVIPPKVAMWVCWLVVYIQTAFDIKLPVSFPTNLGRNMYRIDRKDDEQILSTVKRETLADRKRQAEITRQLALVVKQYIQPSRNRWYFNFNRINEQLPCSEHQKLLSLANFILA